MVKPFLKVLGIAVFTVGLALPGWAQEGWVFSTDDHQWRGTASVSGTSGEAVALSCTRPGAVPAAYPDGKPIRAHEKDTINFFMSPQEFGMQEVGPSSRLHEFEISVDGKILGRMATVLVTPEFRFGANVPSNSPLLDALKQGSTFGINFVSSGKSLQVPLTRSASAINALLAFCSNPVVPTQASGSQGGTAARTGSLSTLSANPRPPVSNSLVGRWEGGFECRWGYTEAVLEVGHGTDSDYRAFLTYRTDPDQAKGAYPRGGYYDFVGDAVDGDGRATFTFVTALRTERGRPWKLRSFLVEREGSTLSGGATDGGSCTLGMNLVAPAEAAVPDEAEPASGDWYLRLACDGTESAEAEFEVGPRRPDGTYEGNLVINTANSLSKGTSHTRYLGEPDSDNPDAIRFVVIDTIRAGIAQPRPGGFKMSPRPGTLEFQGGACRALEVSRMTENSLRLSPTFVPPDGGGTFQLANTPREKCEAVVTWTDKLGKEYPDTDFFRSSKSSDREKTIKLFADDEFIPVFGAPYDQMTYDARHAIIEYVRRECYRDPFMKGSMEPFRSAAERALMGGNRTQELTTKGYSSIVFAIRNIRRVRNELAAMSTVTTEAVGGLGFVQAVARFDEVKRSIQGNADILWPSERQDAISLVDRKIADLAQTEAMRLRDSAVTQTEPREGVRIANDTLLEIERVLGQHLSGKLKKEVTDAIENSRTGLVRDLENSLMKMAQAAPVSLQGAHEILRLTESGILKSELLREDEHERFEAGLGKELDELLFVLVEAETQALGSFPADLNGLKASADWIEDFTQRFSEFSEVASVETVKEEYRSHREQLLEDAFPLFEKAVADANDEEEIDMLLEQFLSWSADASLPVALEYEFVAELGR